MRSRLRKHSEVALRRIAYLEGKILSGRTRRQNYLDALALEQRGHVLLRASLRRLRCFLLGGSRPVVTIVHHDEPLVPA